MSEVILTKKGLEKLKNELAELKSVKRKEVANRIQDAKEYGDLAENSEYDDAKNEQAFVEGRIAELEHMIKNAKIISKKKCSKKVETGCSVVLNSDLGEQRFMIVGMAESDPENGLISEDSPIGQALLGKLTGDLVEVEAPDGKIQYKIKNIE